MREKCFGDWMAGADLRLCGIGYFGWLPGAAAVPTHIPSCFLADISYRYQALPLAHQPAHSSNPKALRHTLAVASAGHPVTFEAAYALTGR